MSLTRALARAISLARIDVLGAAAVAESNAVIVDVSARDDDIVDVVVCDVVVVVVVVDMVLFGCCGCG